MMSNEIQSLFATAIKTYAPVEGQPSDPYLSTLWDTLTMLLLPIVYDGKKGNHNLVGLIMDEDVYKTLYGANFLTPARPEIYNVEIPINTSNSVRVRRKAAQTAKKEDYRIFSVFNRDSSKFVLAVVEDTWVRELRNPDLFYTAVKPQALLAHLQTLCVGLHTTEVLNLQNEMQTYNYDMAGIPTYINQLEDTHKQSNRAGNPIMDPTLLLFTANAILRTDRFPRANEIWEDLSGADQTWARWKIINRKANMADKVKQDHFGAHGAFDKVPNPEAPEALPRLSVEDLNGYFSPLANAATTEKDILATLVRINATLTTSNATLTATVSTYKNSWQPGEDPNPPLRNQPPTTYLSEFQKGRLSCG